jgi:Flp pilus assembly protein TadD
MAAGYLLALVPTLAAAAGFVAGVVRLVRRPTAEDFLLVGLVVSLGVAIVYHFLRYPYLCHAKGYYALAGLVPLAAFGAWGLDPGASSWRPVRPLAAVFLGTWALTAYFSFWVSPDAAETQACVARHLRDQGLKAEAAEYLRRAVARHPTDANLLRACGEVHFDLGDNARAQEFLRRALDADPRNAGALLTRSLLSQDEKQPEQALAEARRATEAAPEDTRVWPHLARLLAQANQPEAAAEALREALAVAPYDAALHYRLGVVLAGTGRRKEALAAFRTAVRLKPGATAFVDRVAWVLATAEEEELRDGPEAVRLSEAVCHASGYRNPALLDTLAAAWACCGRFDRAKEVSARASALASAAGDRKLLQEIEGRRRLYQAGRPYRE